MALKHGWRLPPLPPNKKRAGHKVLAMLKGLGCTQNFGVVLTQALEVLAMLKGGGVPPCKRGGGGVSAQPVIFPFCNPPLRPIKGEGCLEAAF